MSFWNTKHISTAISDVEFYNMTEKFSANGIKVHTGDFISGNIAVLKKNDEDTGIDEASFKFVQNKASAIMCTDEKYFEKYNLPIIKVKNTKDAVIMMAYYIRKIYEGKVIGITGSCGKSTVTKMCYDVLEQYGASANTNRANINFSIAWNMTSYDVNSKYWVNETSLGGGMELNSYLTKPHIAVVTNIAPVHLNPKQTLEIIAKTKAKIFTAMKANDYAILYKDTEYFDVIKNAAKEKMLNIITVGKDNDCNIKLDFEKHLINVFNTNYAIKNTNIADHLFIDYALTLGVLYALNLPLEPAIEILSNWTPIIGRGQVLEGKLTENKSITMIDESYNANPLSMKSCLESFNKTYSDRTKVLIIGDMAEGGVNSTQQHMELVDTIKQINPAVLICCGNQIKPVWDELKRKYTGSYYTTIEPLLADFETWVQDGDCIFVKGSHSVELFKLTTMFRNKLKNV